MRETGRRPALGQAALFTLLFSLAAHGFRFLRLDFAHDATLVYQCDDVWQIRLGRYLMPLYARLRGQLVAPWWVGLLAVGFLALSVWLVCGLLELKSPLFTALAAGVMVTAPTLTIANAAYLPWSDVYTLSLLCAVTGVWLWRRYPWGFAAAILPLAASVALYPSYIQAAAFLMLAVLAGDCLAPEWDAKALVRRGFTALAALAGGLALYGGGYLAVLAALGLKTGAAPNSVVHAVEYAGVDIFALLGETWLSVWQTMAAPRTLWPAVGGLCNLLMLAFALAALALLLKPLKPSPSRYALLALVLALMPFGVNCVYFLTKGNTHDLMHYPFALGGVACLALGQRLEDRAPLLSRRLLALVLAVSLFSATAFSNQVYLKQALDADNTRSVLTRVLDRMEQTLGYEPGKTPVALVGTLQAGPLAMRRPGFAHIQGTGLDGDFAVTHLDSYGYYFEYVMGCPVNLLPRKEAQAAAEQAPDLEPFPARNCAVLLPDGTLVFRLS